MRLKELMKYLKTNKLVKYLTPNLSIDVGYFTNLVFEKESNCLAFVMKDEGKPLTTANVREFITTCSGISEDTLITINAPILEENNNNLVRWISENDEAIAITEKLSENVELELKSRFADIIRTCFYHGFTLEDFRLIGDEGYSFVKTIKKEFGLFEINNHRK